MMCFLSQLIKKGSVRSRPWVLTFHLPVKKKKKYTAKSKQTKRKSLFRDPPKWWVLYFFSCFLKTVPCLITLASIDYRAYSIFSIWNPEPIRCPLANKECVTRVPRWRSHVFLGMSTWRWPERSSGPSALFYRWGDWGPSKWNDLHNIS